MNWFELDGKKLGYIWVDGGLERESQNTEALRKKGRERLGMTFLSN